MPLTGTPSNISYPGILDPIGCDLMRSNGTTPDVLRVRFTPQPGAPAPAGPLVIGYGARTLELLDCKLDNVRVIRSDQRGTQFEASIFDGRWRWQWGGISGDYNQTDPHGDLIKRTERTPQQLATMLLRAMFGLDPEENPPTKRAGSKRRAQKIARSNAAALPFDVSKLPNDSRPRTQWDEAVPAHALGQLCESLGCLVSYKWNNRVVIERVGEGAPLPNNDDVKELSLTLDPKEIPDEFVVVTPPPRFEVALPLVAIGRDTDGAYKDPYDLSYLPDNEDTQVALFQGWLRGTSAVTGEPQRSLAEETIYRSFRIQVQREWTAEPVGRVLYLSEEVDPLYGRQMNGDDGWNLELPSFGAVDELWQILPVERSRVRFEFDKTREDYIGQQPTIFGLFSGTLLDGADPNKNNFDPTLANLDESVHALPRDATWSIDASRGIVHFSAPVWRWGTSIYDNDGNLKLQPMLFPILFLRTTVSVKDWRSGSWTRYYRRRRVGSYGTAGKRLFREDLQLSAIVDYDYDENFRPTTKRKGGTGRDANEVTGITDNRDKVDQAADLQIDASLRLYQMTAPQLGVYRGIQNIECDGAIRQVAIRVGGQQFTTTSASRNDELIGSDLTLTEKLRIDYLYADFVKRDQQTPAVQASNQRRQRQGQ